MTNYPSDFADTHVKFERAYEILKDCKRVLDVGCADGSFSVLLEDSEVYGVDVSKDAVVDASNKGVFAQLVNVDIERLPFENEFFDGVFCGEVIEHLRDPDHLLDEVYRVLRKNGVCVLTTPNLASWYNRIFLLFGYQPLFTEVSLKYGVGHPIKWWLAAGHLRVFTLKALTELVVIHKFKIVSTIGFGINTRIDYWKRWRVLVEIVNKLFCWPSVCSDIMLVLKK